MPAEIRSAEQSITSSPSMSLADFDYDSDSPQEQPGLTLPTLEIPPGSYIDGTREVPSSSTAPDPPSKIATQSDIASLRELIQRGLEQLRLQIEATSITTDPTPPPPPPKDAPTEALADMLRIELSAKSARITALEEETRKLRAENQALQAVIEGVGNWPKHLTSANQELRRVYIERQSLWDERAALWKERGELWSERADLWGERQALWDERDRLKAICVKPTD